MNRIPNPNANKFVEPEGYKNLGWQIASDNPDMIKCFESGHKLGNELREFDNSLFLWRCTDVVRICDVCKIYHHIDMSD